MRQEEIHIGDFIFYKLRPSDNPINPKEEHRAFVKKKKFIEPDIWMISIQVPDRRSDHTHRESGDSESG